MPAPERVRIESDYVLPEKRGRLHIAALPVFRPRDNSEVLQITITARGAPVSPAEDDVIAWIELGREWVVRGFTDFTASDVHSMWGRTS